MEFLKLVLVVAAVAISTFPRFSHSMTLLYPVSFSNDSFIAGVGLFKDGDYGIVCDEGDTDITDFLCNNLGGFDNDSYIDPSMLNVSFVNFSCPSGFSSCGEAASIVPNCSTPLLIVCSFSDCFPGQLVQLTNSVNVSTGSGVALVGYPEVCVNGNFAPICNGTELGAIELILICAYQPINSSTGLIGNPHNVGLSPFMPSAPLSVTGYDCDIMANCAVTTGMNCGTNGYAIVTCEEGIPSSSACDPNAYVNGSILFNNETNVSADGSVVTTGIYQSCTGGSYVRYCTYPSQWGYPSLVDIANGICISLGYSFGVIVPFENRFYQDLPPGISAIDINCTSVEGSECNYTLCDDINRQMVLRCTRSRGCLVTGGYLYNNITRISNGREYTSGVFVNCESGYYQAICQTNGTDLSNLCSSDILGYEGKFYHISISFNHLFRWSSGVV
ncbi:PREDICTED: uncharacterized protein LOC109583465 [Amphimedon queenslandica]|uniref:SRCR domain-containing protein n=1 Tax=Amphimedon queenslandica TaxID=400682 RepID=A0AAN0JCC4_AMPQE|nr:PREDICTED: uncharacterized protein LOC109583465 [Amphimedon queenslandica]|eukprot:XP_019854396.1 PREDICTED: uncharacterized protein LOC109583465 [Amphimedon queenslandica]